MNDMQFMQDIANPEIGGFFDSEKTQYLQRTTTYPKWQNGYGFIDTDGYLALEGQGWSNRIGRRI